jgi:hypothetical protein
MAARYTSATTYAKKTLTLSEAIHIFVKLDSPTGSQEGLSRVTLAVSGDRRTAAGLARGPDPLRFGR